MDVWAMYYLFKFHHLLPSAYMDAGAMERRVVWAFLNREIKEYNEANKG